MEKQIRIVKKGQDESNLEFWLLRSASDRMIQLEKIRQTVNKRKYGARSGFQRVYRIAKRVSS